MSNSDTSCPIPINEEQRLRALHAHAILDTPPELEFDALARVATYAFATPLAVVALMDADRLWFKSRIGLDVPQLDRQVAFCAHAIAQPDAPLIVGDLSQDRRFTQNPLVCQAPHLRFYAGAPIVDARGLALGTMAVLDTEPRAFTEAQAHALQDMASLVMGAMEGRRRALQLAHMAMTDHLTGLSTRAQFDRALEAELAHAMRTGEPFTVLCMDLDGFKEVNDGFGHAAGDEVLCEVSRRLAQQVRVGDVLARFGGDEFGIVMRHGAKDSAQVLAKRIVKAVSAPITLSSGDVIGVGVSVGMAAYTDEVLSVKMLLAQADQALYQAKKQNAQRWKMFVGIR